MPIDVALMEAFEERAAILEFDAGLTRTEAERRARAAYGLAPDPNHSRHSDRRTHLMIELLPPEQQKAAQDLMMSRTMDLLVGLAQGENPLDWTRTEDLKAGFCTASLDVIRALDAGRIRFERDHDAAMLHGLLLVAMQFVFDGKFGQGAEIAKAN